MDIILVWVPRSVTEGSLLSNKSQDHLIHDITLADIDSIEYCEVAEERQWRIEPLLHLLEEREAGGLDEEDLEWLDYLCSN